MLAGPRRERPTHRRRANAPGRLHLARDEQTIDTQEEFAPTI
jgi:hypothetical protein